MNHNPTRPDLIAARGRTVTPRDAATAIAHLAEAKRLMTLAHSALAYGDENVPDRSSLTVRGDRRFSKIINEAGLLAYGIEDVYLEAVRKAYGKDASTSCPLFAGTTASAERISAFVETIEAEGLDAANAKVQEMRAAEDARRRAAEIREREEREAQLKALDARLGLVGEAA